MGPLLFNPFFSEIICRYLPTVIKANTRRQRWARQVRDVCITWARYKHDFGFVAISLSACFGIPSAHQEFAVGVDCTEQTHVLINWSPKKHLPYQDKYYRHECGRNKGHKLTGYQIMQVPHQNNISNDKRRKDSLAPLRHCRNKALIASQYFGVRTGWQPGSLMVGRQFKSSKAARQLNTLRVCSSDWSCISTGWKLNSVDQSQTADLIATWLITWHYSISFLLKTPIFEYIPSDYRVINYQIF